MEDNNLNFNPSNGLLDPSVVMQVLNLLASNPKYLLMLVKSGYFEPLSLCNYSDGSTLDKPSSNKSAQSNETLGFHTYLLNLLNASPYPDDSFKKNESSRLENNIAHALAVLESERAPAPEGRGCLGFIRGMFNR